MGRVRGLVVVVSGVLALALAGCTATSTSSLTSADVSPSGSGTSAVPAPTGSMSPSPQWPAALAEEDFWYSSTEPTWAVYLAAADSSDDHSDVVDRATALGYDEVTWIPMGFHTSAASVFDEGELAGTESGYSWTLVLFFADEASARTFVDLWREPVLGVASGMPAGDFD